MQGNSTYRKILIEDVKKQFPELTETEMSTVLIDLVRVPQLFKKLLTETQVNLKTYERRSKGKKVRTDYKLSLDTVLPIRESMDAK